MHGTTPCDCISSNAIFGSAAVPPRSPLEVLGGWLRWAGMIFLIGVPIWLAQGFVALLGATLG
jgi:hypothetical protein